MWKDITSYSRDAKERSPTSFSNDVDGIRVTVTCGHVQYRPYWIMHCYQLGINTYPLDDAPEGIEGLDIAKEKAISIVFKKSQKIAKAIEKMLEGN